MSTPSFEMRPYQPPSESRSFKALAELAESRRIELLKCSEDRGKEWKRAEVAEEAVLTLEKELAREKVAFLKANFAGWCEALDQVRGSLKGYPGAGGDSLIMDEVDRIVREAIDNTRIVEDGFGSSWLPCPKCHNALSIMRPGDARCLNCENATGRFECS